MPHIRKFVSRDEDILKELKKMKNTLSDYEMTELANKAISELVYPKT